MKNIEVVNFDRKRYYSFHPILSKNVELPDLVTLCLVNIGYMTIIKLT